MATQRCATALALLAAVGVCWLAVAAPPRAVSPERREIKEAQEALVKLADVLKKKPTAARKQAAALARNAELEHFHHAFKLRARGGIGVGPKPGAIKPDGIEAKIIALRKRVLTAAQLKKEQAALVRMGEITRAVAEVTPFYAPKGKAAKLWKDAAQAMKLAAEDLSDAARAGDRRKIKKAAENLGASCVQCHATWGR